MRQVFGVQYGRDQLPVPTWSEEFGLDDFSTKLTDFVSVGADFRTEYFNQQSPGTATNAFSQFQGDVYMNFRLAKKVNIYLDKGLDVGFEIFGLLNILPENGYVKVGKFLPNYGVKLDDHIVAPGGEHTGGEVAIAPGPVTIIGGVYNSVDPKGSSIDNNKLFLGRVEGMFKASDVNIGVGANVLTGKDLTQSGVGERATLAGAFGSLSYQNFTIFGEADLQKNTYGSSSVDSTGVITFVEADYVVTTGLDLKVRYEFIDLNKDIKSGSTSRYSFGFEFFPISGVEVRPMYRISKEDPVDIKNNEFDLMLHFYL